ncbi:LCP family protein [Caldibacillus thermoamylovorans]|uniref:LCP family protein n=1 Tax=Caldibacillus thermoamylovorans TaxID=35841 RepID=UPI00203D836E|nr:LCP family protein [Caldibacillus thermoamylovorans]MCM3797740.1 LCP family protein [Caldibacillus thermoamylovorans]
MNMNRSDKKRKRSKKRRKILYVFLLLLFLCVVGYAGYLYFFADHILSKSYESDGREKSDYREKVVDPSKDNVSVLIIGVDESKTRENLGGFRSDTLILATLNKKEHSVKMLSIPRDSYVHIPEVDYKTRINHAYARGGVPSTIKTVENLLDIPVDYYVKVNFEAFIDVVDALGGITVDVPYEIYEQNSKDIDQAIHLKPGKQQLNGEEALALARTRKQDNDIERGKRQQDIIKAIVKKSVSLGSVFKYDDLLEAVGENIKTNMTFGEMKSFISYGLEGDLQFETLTLAGSDYWKGKAYYYQLDEKSLEDTKKILKDHLKL